MKTGRLVLIIAFVVCLPSREHAEKCTVSSTWADGSVRGATCTKGGTKTPKGSPVTVAPLAPLPSPGRQLAASPSTFTAAFAQAIAAAQTGPVTILLSPGTYTGNFVFPRTGAPYGITIAGPFLAPGRVQPAMEGSLPRLVPEHLDTATVTVQGDEYIFRSIQIDSPGVGYTTVELDAASQPKHITFDQVLIRGRADTGGHRGIAANGVDVTVTNSWIDRMWEVGRDAQAIAAWDTPGPLTVTNNYLEASGENFLLGGATPTYSGAVTADVVFSGNTVEKDPLWRSMSTSPQVKNLFEVKSGRRITATGNTFRYNWQQAQTGWSILITTNSDSGAGNVAEDILFAGNLIRDVASGINIAAVSGPIRRLILRDNVWANLDYLTWGGDGRFAIVQAGTAGIEDLTITHQTVLQATGNQFLGLYGDVPIVRFMMTHNLLERREYGIHSVSGLAAAALAAAAPGALFRDNAIIGSDDYWITWPAGNFLRELSLSDQVDASYRLLVSSPLATLPTSDGAQVGADSSQVAR